MRNLCILLKVKWQDRITRFKDTLKHNMKQCGINVDQWETVAGDRARWRAGIKQGVKLFEGVETRCRRREESDPEKQLTAAAGVCMRRRLQCLSEIATRE